MREIEFGTNTAENSGVRTDAYLNSIIAEAEATAREIIDQAEDEARRFVDGVREQSDRAVARRAEVLAELSDSLIEHAELLRRRSQELLDSLEQSPQPASPDRMVAPEPPAPPPAPISFDQKPPSPAGGADQGSPPPAAAFDQPPSPLARDDRQPQPPPAEAERFSAGARLLATQMAVAGSSVEDVRSRLINDFGIADPQPLLDLVFGPG